MGTLLIDSTPHAITTSCTPVEDGLTEATNDPAVREARCSGEPNPRRVVEARP